jgi:hypothetical protein
LFVITVIRFVVGFFCAIAVAGPVLFAQKLPRPNGSNATLSPELLAFLASQPKWSASVAAESGFGYNDNLLLSYAGEERSAFARGSVELEVLRVRMPGDRFEYSLLTEADRTHFFSGKNVDHEAKALAVSDVGYHVGDTLRFGLPLTGYYFDQVFDQSDTEAERFVAKLKGSGATIGPTIRWTFHPSWWIEAQAVGERKRYEDGANDGDVGEGNMRLTWKPGPRFEVRLTGAERWRNFERRARFNATGREIFGTELKISEREGEVRFAVKWDKAARWQTVTRASLLDYRDNGSGFFNFREKKIAQDLDWENERWRLQVGASARRINFEVQTVGLGIEPPARLKDAFSADVRADCKLTKRWTIFATYTWERTRSNDLFASYNVNEGLLGVHWSWEK